MTHHSRYITLFKEMIAEVLEKNNVKAIPLYYDKDFELRTNGKKFNYDEFMQNHIDYNKTFIQYKIRYDEETFVEQGNKIAGRLFQTLKKSNVEAQEIEIIFIAIYKASKLYRFWHLSYPDWSQLKNYEPQLD